MTTERMEKRLTGVLGKERVENAKKLSAVAMSVAFLVRERVIAEENYDKCLRVWIDKHANGDRVLQGLASSALSYEKMSAALPKD